MTNQFFKGKIFQKKIWKKFWRNFRKLNICLTPEKSLIDFPCQKNFLQEFSESVDPDFSQKKWPQSTSFKKILLFSYPYFTKNRNQVRTGKKIFLLSNLILWSDSTKNNRQGSSENIFTPLQKLPHLKLRSNTWNNLTFIYLHREGITPQQSTCKHSQRFNNGFPSSKYLSKLIVTQSQTKTTT